MIPAFNHSHVLPPFLGGDPRVFSAVSPYQTDVLELAQRFAHFPNRRLLLDGLLEYRADLASLGFVRGFQWLDGSFSEDIESSEARPPADIDLVTFAYAPPGVSSTALTKLLNDNPSLFLADQAKQKYGCDAYIVPLDKSPENLVKRSTYYFNLFSHRHGDHVWKGLLQIPLQNDDALAQELLQNMKTGEPDAASA